MMTKIHMQRRYLGMVDALFPEFVLEVIALSRVRVSLWAFSKTLETTYIVVNRVTGTEWSFCVHNPTCMLEPEEAAKKFLEVIRQENSKHLQLHQHSHDSNESLSLFQNTNFGI